MVQHALVHGVKPTARVFAMTAKTVRKWLRRYRQERLAGLNELPRIPLRCPHKTSPV
ncbi:MAG: helix-turn-helix domain-containing protein, partial [Planctomycetota bacterium]